MFITTSGRRFALAYYSLLEWAEIVKAALLYLGCSEEYAESAYQDYATAERLS
jgi:hypothetical protein